MKISVFGTENSEKSLFLSRIFNVLNLKSKNYKRSDKVQVNYLEEEFFLDQKKYLIVNLPHFDHFNKEENFSSLSKKINEKNKKNILESDLVVLLCSKKTVKKEFFSILKFIESKDKEHSIIFLKNQDSEIDDVDFSLKNKDFYEVSLLSVSDFKKTISIFLKEKLSLELEKSPYSNKKKLKKAEKVENNSFSISIVGPPNSGKSSLLNHILGYERSLVDNFKGTTKEEVHSSFFYNKLRFEIFDTEGLFKKDAIYTVKSIKNCDLILLVIDSSLGINNNILRLIDLAMNRKTSLAIVLNKIDLLDETSSKNLEVSIRQRIKSYSFVPLIPISVKKQINFKNFFTTIEKIVDQSSIYLSKKIVTDYSKKLIENNQPPLVKGKRLKIYYGIHEKGFVHKFIFFVNETKCVHFSYERYIINSIRKVSGILNLPIRVFFKKS